MSDSLLAQLLKRVVIFKQNFPSVSQAAIAKYCNVEESNLSAAIAGKRGLSADSVIRLHTLFNLSKPDVLALFTKPALSSHIMRLQERGKPMQLANSAVERLRSTDQFDSSNSGWVSREGGTDDPVDTTDITETRKASRITIRNIFADIDSLDELTRASVIDQIQRAYPNPSGTTAPNGQRFSR